MIDKSIPESFMVTERGVRKSARYGPHSMAFPAMMSALKTFMGLPPRLRDMEYYGKIWKVDDDYFFQMGISAESFGLCYGTPDMLKAGKWDNQRRRWRANPWRWSGPLLDWRIPGKRPVRRQRPK